MKMKPLLIGVCLLTVLTGCDKPKSNDVITTAEDTIKANAAASIKALYPDVNSSDLKFTRLMISVGNTGEQTVWVSFDLPSSEMSVTNNNKIKTTVKQFRVTMSLSGQVKSFSQSTGSEIHFLLQPTQPMTYTAPKLTPAEPSGSNSP